MGARSRLLGRPQQSQPTLRAPPVHRTAPQALRAALQALGFFRDHERAAGGPRHRQQQSAPPAQHHGRVAGRAGRLPRRRAPCRHAGAAAAAAVCGAGLLGPPGPAQGAQQGSRGQVPPVGDPTSLQPAWVWQQRGVRTAGAIPPPLPHTCSAAVPACPAHRAAAHNQLRCCLAGMARTSARTISLLAS